MNTALCRSGLLVSCIEPSHRSTSNHLLPSPDLGLVFSPEPTARSADRIPRETMASVGLRLELQVGHDNRPNRVRHPADQWFTFSCSPPPLTRTQLLSVSTFRPNLAGTCTPLIRYTYKRTTLGPLGRTPQDIAQHNTRCGRYTRAAPFVGSTAGPSARTTCSFPHFFLHGTESPCRFCQVRDGFHPFCAGHVDCALTHSAWVIARLDASPLDPTSEEPTRVYYGVTSPRRYAKRLCQNRSAGRGRSAASASGHSVGSSGRATQIALTALALLLTLWRPANLQPCTYLV